MFFKSSLLAIVLAVPVVFAKVDEGIYRIRNFQSGTSVRSYRVEEPLYVSNTLELPGPFELFDIRNGDKGGQTVKHLGLDALVDAIPEKEGVPVIATFKKIAPTQWEISPAGEGVYTIQVAGKDLLWNAERPVVPHGEVKVQASNGAPSQRWLLERVDRDFETEASESEAEAEKFGHLLGEILSQVGHELLDH